MKRRNKNTNTVLYVGLGMLAGTALGYWQKNQQIQRIKMQLQQKQQSSGIDLSGLIGSVESFEGLNLKGLFGNK